MNGKRWNGIGYNTKNNKVFELFNGCGLVKEYYDNGKLKYEGEYLNREKNGKGKEYHENGRLKFEREYINGEKKDIVNIIMRIILQNLKENIWMI